MATPPLRFKHRPVAPLWSPRPGVNPNWRVSTAIQGQVLPLRAAAPAAADIQVWRHPGAIDPSAVDFPHPTDPARRQVYELVVPAECSGIGGPMELWALGSRAVDRPMRDGATLELMELVVWQSLPAELREALTEFALNVAPRVDVRERGSNAPA